MTACMSWYLCHSQEDIDLLVHLQLLQHVAGGTQDPGLMSTRPVETKVVLGQLSQATNDCVYELVSVPQPRRHRPPGPPSASPVRSWRHTGPRTDEHPS